MFHRIVERHDPFRPGFDVSLFEQFCGHVAETYEVLPLGELEQQRVAGRDLSRHVALTFDDGYLDNYVLALPLLRRYGLPATLFLTTGAVAGGKPLWTSRAVWIIEHGRSEGAPAEFLGTRLQLEDRGRRVTTALDLVQRLRFVDPSNRDELLDDLASRLGVVDFTGVETETVSWEQLREMDRAGFCAQPHTVSHPILSLLDARQIEQEIAQSKAAIEGHLRRPAELFAYPRGTAEDFDERALLTLKRLAFRAAYTTEFAAIRASDDPLRLPRLSVYARTAPEMAVQLERFFYLRTSQDR